MADGTGRIRGRRQYRLEGLVVDGKPTRVLTWYGTPSRYFPPGNNPSSDFDTEIYQNGVLYALAPDPVLGAALMREADGSEWLIAIVADGTSDVVYRKPNIQDISDALYDPDTAPNGWQVMGTFPGIDGYYPDVPWFFNGDGTEAQTIRGHLSDNLSRLKITISGGSAQRSNLGNLAKPTQEWSESWHVSCSGQADMPMTCGGGFKSCGYTREVKYRHIKQNGRPASKYIVAVDYLDDQELLLYATFGGYSTNEEISRSYTKVNYLYYPNGELRGDRREEDKNYTRTITADDKIGLSLNGHEFRFKYKVKRSYSYDFNSEFAGEFYNNETNPPPERDSARSTETESKVQQDLWFISYADIRSGVIVSRESIETIEGGGSGETKSTEEHYYYSGDNTDIIDDTVIKHAGSVIPTEPNNYGWTTEGQVNPTWITYGEKIQSCSTEAFEVNDSTGDSGPVGGFADGFAYEVIRPIGAAVDRNGHLLLSFLYNNSGSQRAPLSTWVGGTKQFNYLSGGDLTQFAVGTPDELSFNPVSVY